MTEPLLELRDLNIAFDTERGTIRPVRDVSLSIYPGQTLAVVGESGCGKSVTALSILRLIPSPPGRVLGGSVKFEGRDLLSLTERQMQGVRGKDIAMIFQEPMTSLNPVFTIGEQIAEAVTLHQKVGARRAYEIAEQSLRDVGIADPGRRIHEYPHQMSGGMRQRVMIAMALSCQPKLLIADEPTTALDVTIQAQILELLRKLQRERGMSIMLITHDLGVVAENADAVAVMYASRVVEYAKVEDLFDRPRHPYTEALFRSVPVIGAPPGRLETIAGSVPNPAKFPVGCKFHTRCPRTRAEATKIAVESHTQTQSANDPSGARTPTNTDTGGTPTPTTTHAGGASTQSTNDAGENSTQAPKRAVESSPRTTKILFDRQETLVAARCVAEEPMLREIAPGHWSACFFNDNYDASPPTLPKVGTKRSTELETAQEYAAGAMNVAAGPTGDASATDPSSTLNASEASR